MLTENVICVICDFSATAERTDHGHRKYIACSNDKCGDYEISSRAAEKIAGNADQKATLQEMVGRANDAGRILDISIASDGLFQATSVERILTADE